MSKCGCTPERLLCKKGVELAVAVKKANDHFNHVCQAKVWHAATQKDVDKAWEEMNRKLYEYNQHIGAY